MLTVWLMAMTNPHLLLAVILSEIWLLEHCLPKEVFEMIGRVRFVVPVAALAYLAFLWVTRPQKKRAGRD
jgi:hypothetical protein